MENELSNCIFVYNVTISTHFLGVKNENHIKNLFSYKIHSNIKLDSKIIKYYTNL